MKRILTTLILATLCIVNIDAQESNVSDKSNTNPPSDSETLFENNRKGGMIELGYMAQTFDDVKASGSYGLSMTILPTFLKIANHLYGGFHLAMLNFNFGLVPIDFTSVLIDFGPAIGYYFTPTIFVTIPLNVSCQTYGIGSESGRKSYWGMSLSPSLYVGKKAGVYIGPRFSMAFEGKSKVSCGFQAGIYF